MDRLDVQDFLAMIEGAYPNFNPKDRTASVNAWTTALEEYSSDEAALAFKLYMKTNTSGFAPVYGQIIEKIAEITQPEQLNEMEAWAMVSKAIRNSGYNSVEEFSNLPPLVQKAVGLPDQLRTWALDEGYREDVVRSHFISCYKSVVQKEKECQKLPWEAKKLIEKTNRGSESAKIEQKRQEIVGDFEERKQERNRSIEVKNIVSQAPDSYYDLIRELGGEANEVN